MSFSELSMSSSSSQKTTRPNSEAMTHSINSFKSINSNCVNKETLEKDDANTIENQNEEKHCFNAQAKDKPLCHNAQSNLIIPQIHIELVEANESNGVESDNPDCLNSNSELTSYTEKCVSLASVPILNKSRQFETMINKMTTLKLRDTTIAKQDQLHGMENSSIRKKPSQKIQSLRNVRRIPKPQKELSIKEYHKYVAQKSLLETLRRKHAPQQNKSEISSSMKKRVSPAASPKVKRLKSKKLTSFNKLKSHSYLDIHLKNLNENANKSDECNVLIPKPSIPSASNNDFDDNLDLDLSNTSVTLPNNAQRFSLKQLKSQSKTAISSIQKFIEVTFDRGKC